MADQGQHGEGEPARTACQRLREIPKLRGAVVKLLEVEGARVELYRKWFEALKEMESSEELGIKEAMVVWNTAPDMLAAPAGSTELTADEESLLVELYKACLRVLAKVALVIPGQVPPVVESMGRAVVSTLAASRRRASAVGQGEATMHAMAALGRHFSADGDQSGNTLFLQSAQTLGEVDELVGTLGKAGMADLLDLHGLLASVVDEEELPFLLRSGIIVKLRDRVYDIAQEVAGKTPVTWDGTTHKFAGSFAFIEYYNAQGPLAYNATIAVADVAKEKKKAVEGALTGLHETVDKWISTLNEAAVKTADANIDLMHSGDDDVVGTGAMLHLAYRSHDMQQAEDTSTLFHPVLAKVRMMPHQVLLRANVVKQELPLLMAEVGKVVEFLKRPHIEEAVKQRAPMPQLTADALEGMHTVLSPPNNDSNVSGEAAAVINEYLAYIVAPHVLAHFKEMAAKKSPAVFNMLSQQTSGMGLYIHMLNELDTMLIQLSNATLDKYSLRCKSSLEIVGVSRESEVFAERDAAEAAEALAVLAQMVAEHKATPQDDVAPARVKSSQQTAEALATLAQPKVLRAHNFDASITNATPEDDVAYSTPSPATARTVQRAAPSPAPAAPSPARVKSSQQTAEALATLAQPKVLRAHNGPANTAAKVIEASKMVAGRALQTADGEAMESVAKLAGLVDVPAAEP
ncbi:hypothetical protein C2E20_5809 [Micractinium conductrix]|uniref:Uncharacterized protein n=1 Tax=Micractinium conductrix TaxID=554055 RepID=A0A2P6V9E1_9CHLO|nr:hypothetical protein C2E20_5809 [Micractinium conductrix]|eukprot:PSC70707.1 hypothetical protein C2E20_5809 [Micractinium conductrix]